MAKLTSPTLKDVAQRANLSAATVSRYLSGQLSLPDDTVRRIKQAVSTLGYRPNVIARRLSTGRSELIGFATSDIAYSFFAEIASAAEAEAEANGYGLVIFSTRNQLSKELGVLAKIEDGHVDGAILLTNHLDDGKLAEAVTRSGRIVLMDEDVPGATAPRIFAENVRGAYLATAHLLEQGHRSIAFIGGRRGLISTDERYQGYVTALQEFGLTPDPQLARFGDYGAEYGIIAFHELWRLSERPSAIFVATDHMAMSVIAAANTAGVSIPANLSIVGFDDLTVAPLLAPALTTVRQSPLHFGQVGVKTLIDLIEDRAAQTEIYRVPVELMVRGSVSAPARSHKRKR